MENVKVTVWLSTYNQEPYVAQALDSILMQKTDFPFEIIAADDCSTDRTQEIILDYQKRYPDMIIPYFPSENIGGCRKLTNCIDAGLFRGEYLSYLEGDDYWLGEDRLQTLVDFLDMHPEYAAVAHQRDMVNEQGEFICPDVPEILLDKPFTIENFLDGLDYSDFGTVFRNYFKSDGAKYHSLLRASRNVIDFQDMFMMQDHGPVYVTSRCFGAYRCARTAGATNYNSITTQPQRSMDHIRICRAVESFYHGHYNLSPMIHREQYKLLFAIVDSMQKEIYQEARHYIQSSDLIRDMPEVLYRSLRGRRFKNFRFALQMLTLKERAVILPKVISFAGKRVLEKIMHQEHANCSKIRGFVVAEQEQI